MTDTVTAIQRCKCNDGVIGIFWDFAFISCQLVILS